MGDVDGGERRWRRGGFARAMSRAESDRREPSALVRAAARSRARRRDAPVDSAANELVAAAESRSRLCAHVDELPVPSQVWWWQGSISVLVHAVLLVMLLVAPLAAGPSVGGVFEGLVVRGELILGGSERMVAGRGLGLAGFLAALVIVVATVRRESSVVACLANNGGWVDPRDGRPLVPGARDARRARDYWWTWLITREPFESFDERRRASDRGGRPAALEVFWWSLTEVRVAALLLLLVPVVEAVMVGRDPIGAVLVPGAALLILCVIRVVPRLAVPPDPPRRRCRSCDQALLAGVDRCPECARSLDGDRHRPAREARARGLARSMAIMAIGLVAMASVGGPQRAIAERVREVVPSRTLIAEVGSSVSWPSDAFDRLVARDLSVAERERLAGTLLSRRLAGAVVPLAAWEWFDRERAVGGLSADLIDRRWEDAIEIERVIVVRDGAALGRTPDAKVGSAGGTAESSLRMFVRFTHRLDPAGGLRVGAGLWDIRLAGREPGREMGGLPMAGGRRQVMDRGGAGGAQRLVAASGGTVDIRPRPLPFLGRRPSACLVLPAAERTERPWPAPPQFVVEIPLDPELAMALTDLIDRGRVPRIELDVVRFAVAGDPTGARVAARLDHAGEFVPVVDGPARWSRRAIQQMPVLVVDADGPDANAPGD